MRKGAFLLFILLLFFTTLPAQTEEEAHGPTDISLQESAQQEPLLVDKDEYGYDFYLDKLIIWEGRLEKEGSIGQTELEQIKALTEELESTAFQDLYLEGTLLEFLAGNEARRAAKESAQPEILEDFLKEARKEQRRERSSENKVFWKRFTLGSAIVGAGLYNLAIYSSESSYNSYLSAGDRNEAYFYQQRWEVLDLAALGSLGFTALNLLINGILQITDLF
ncbi:MAG: hypothetical protein JEY99_19215 [Spirochaetales bacterium]|nr:hypothetical protein [Spirochaetales bacterium]